MHDVTRDTATVVSLFLCNPPKKITGIPLLVIYIYRIFFFMGILFRENPLRIKN